METHGLHKVQGVPKFLDAQLYCCAFFWRGCDLSLPNVYIWKIIRQVGGGRIMTMGSGVQL